MITVRIQGGLGNQMFIYAAGRAWAEANATELALDTINGGYGSQEAFKRSYKLDHYCVKAREATSEETIKYNPSSRGFYWRRKLNSLLPPQLRSLIIEPRRYNPRLVCSQLRKNAYLAGYWQREDYFQKYRGTIRQELQLKQLPRPEIRAMANSINRSSSVFVHVRRIKYGYKLTFDYYSNAIVLMQSLIARPRFFIFGDDMEWARQIPGLPPDACYIVTASERDDTDDLWLMTQCEHAIIANSSFSWWGAWLGAESSSSLVIAPSDWGYAGKPASEWQTIPCHLETDPRYI